MQEKLIKDLKKSENMGEGILQKATTSSQCPWLQREMGTFLSDIAVAIGLSLFQYYDKAK